MDSIRKWFYKPKKDDKSLLAQFFFADEALNLIAGELDSFDGRKDPERCTTLVNQLRQSQDKVLTITNAIMDVLIGDERANRDFRVKFPEDVLQENLAGQLWFGAECLAAGSSILNHDAESTTMRPIAKALTKSLDNVRGLLREASLKYNTPNGPIKLDSNELVTEMLLESLKIFDRLFAEFELLYVSVMVPVKTTQEYELQELIGVLFSETLQRALKMGLLTQETVDDCDPALMFTIPRLAIVSGLLVFPNGPLCIDKPVEEMSEMFRPFRTLLLRIRELLWTLNKCELYNLEKILCDNEETTSGAGGMRLDTSAKISEDFVARFYSNYPNATMDNRQQLPHSQHHHQQLQQQDNVDEIEQMFSDYESATATNHHHHAASTSGGYFIPNTVQHDAIVASMASSKDAVERPDSLPDHDSLQVISDAAATLSTILNTKETRVGGKPESPDDSGICTENTSLDRSPSLEMNRCECPSTSKDAKRMRKMKQLQQQCEEDSSSLGSTDTTSSFNSTCADDEEIAMALQAAEYANRNEVRAKFRSSADLIHRLYVCIAGVADQLQTNFASDLRNILKAVFLMNASPEPVAAPEPVVQEASMEYRPVENEVMENEYSVDPNILAQEALFDSNVYFQIDEEEGREVEEQLAGDMQQYASVREVVHEIEEELPQPTTMEQTPQSPPVWIPDVEAPKCMSCMANFTVVKRRHHCRHCGKVFCARCSANSVPLPKFGHTKAVRVCNKCFMYHLAPFKM
ncbi:PREDICTED: lateral signaling target protein 2 homolog [Nicrophorus vespilloides]|uniref:Lateral signaling target protein 2 homolog n=1 Tax=Nicrophorus vespilloides TaxID=110193 RepID=A0ABM1MZT3_NICVS|nr:PREDICTED: lateral signaling target protein 2 homolog [Nicrophorus vespilloides]